MKTWVVLFLLLLLAGIAWGLARDIFSRERRALSGTVVAIDLGSAVPKWLTPTPPRLKVRLQDGTLIDVAAKNPPGASMGAP
jgi:hypothetical protein